MSLLRVIILTAIALVVPAGPGATVVRAKDASEDEIVQVEKRLIESRKAILSGRVSVDSRLVRFAQDPSQVDLVKKFVAYFHDGKARLDMEAGDHREQTVFTRDTLIRSMGNARTIEVFGPETRPKDAQGLPDPRRLGLVVWFYESINQLGYEEALLYPNRDHFAVEAGIEDEKPVTKVSFRGSGSDPLRSGQYWRSESQGGFPVFISLRFGEGEKETVRSVTTKLKQWGKKQIWFPSEVVFRLTIGNKVMAEEVDTVTDATFDEDIPEGTFSLAGLDLPKGRLVDVDGKIMTWAGDRLVARPSQLDRQEDINRPSRQQLSLLAGSLLFALVAVLLMRRYAKRKRTCQVKGQ
jgi:hypothetical protein